MRWIIGDIHGMRVTLDALLRAVAARDPQPRFFFAGDYVNRGPDSKGVVDLLLSLPDAKFARGNHDDIFDLLLNGKSYSSGSDASVAFAWFMAHGLDRTLESYGIDRSYIEQTARKPTEDKLVQLVADVPQSHRDFFRKLKPMINSEPDLFIIHAKWETDEPDDSPATRDRTPDGPVMQRMLWGRFSDSELLREKAWNRRGYFGHTPVINYSSMDENVPIIANGAILLDTGAALSAAGRLTAYCADSDGFIQVDREGNVLESVDSRLS